MIQIDYHYYLSTDCPNTKVVFEIMTVSDIGRQRAICHFNELPLELIIRILYCAINTNDYLRKNTFSPYTALLVSKRWNEIVLAAPELWTSFSLNLTNKRESTLALDFPNNAQNDQEIDLYTSA